MIPLTLANMGEDVVIKKVGGSPDVKKHLEDLGLIAGSTVKIVNTFAGNVILDLREMSFSMSKIQELPSTVTWQKKSWCERRNSL